MEKFLKITVSDAPSLIKVSEIMGVEVGADTHIQVLLNAVGHRATGASEVLGYQITSGKANDATKTKEQLRSFVDNLEAALQTSWTNPIYDLTDKLPYPVSAVTQIEEEWSA